MANAFDPTVTLLAQRSLDMSNAAKAAIGELQEKVAAQQQQLGLLSASSSSLANKLLAAGLISEAGLMKTAATLASPAGIMLVLEQVVSEYEASLKKTAGVRDNGEASSVSFSDTPAPKTQNGPRIMLSPASMQKLLTYEV